MHVGGVHCQIVVPLGRGSAAVAAATSRDAFVVAGLNSSCEEVALQMGVALRLQEACWSNKVVALVVVAVFQQQVGWVFSPKDRVDHIQIVDGRFVPVEGIEIPNFGACKERPQR